MKKRKKRRRLRKNLILIFAVLLLACIGGLIFLIRDYVEGNKTMPYYLSSDRPELLIKDKQGVDHRFVRGTKVNIKNRRAKVDETEYCVFELDGITYYVDASILESERRDCVKEKQLYALRDHVLSTAPADFHIAGFVKKKEELTVTGYHELLSDGSIDYYQVNGTGYISSKYADFEYHETKLDDSIYADVYFGQGGDPRAIDYYEKEDFLPRTKMPETVNALYINAEAIALADSYIDVADRCAGINAFVVDVKDCYIDTQLAYESPVMRQYAPSTENIPNSYDTYKENVKKLKDAGYYLIGRITAFKDDSFAVDNPQEALIYNGSLYRYGAVRWPSIFSRKMWEYDVALALEAANEMGFDVIQFDYVRLPEDVEDVELGNLYDETRSQAITNFLRYAAEFLHEQGIYVSADVFGEISGDDHTEFSAFVSYYGQFWPAISNAADAISSMPYPDHFSAYAYGIEAPWYEPGLLMYRWGSATRFAQEKTYDAAKCRTWIMAQDSDPYEVYYDPGFIHDQIKGLRDAGICDGYMTWSASSNLNRYDYYSSVLD